MNKINSIVDKIKEILLWLWQFPQHIIALGIISLFQVHVYFYKDIEKSKVYKNAIFPNPFTLGKYIFVLKKTTNKSIKHECGHSKQSRILGIFYIPIIGIPSLIHNMIFSLLLKVGITWDYYSFYTEHLFMSNYNKRK